MSASWRLLALFVLLSLAACGFHLRGSGESLVARAVTVEGFTPGHPLRQILEQRLASSGSLAADAAEHITLVKESWARRTLSVDDNGHALEYELRYQFSYSFDGAATVQHWSDEVSRDFSFNPAQVLAKSNEEARLREEIQRFAVERILRRLRDYQAGSGQ